MGPSAPSDAKLLPKHHGVGAVTGTSCVLNTAAFASGYAIVGAVFIEG